MHAVPTRTDDTVTEQPLPKVVDAPRRAPVVTVFTRLAGFSPRTKRWHNIKRPNPRQREE
jgi:hypothetical protein